MLSSLLNLFRSTPKGISMDVQKFVEATINDNKIAIFSKSWCPYCKHAKTLFAEKFPDEEPVVVELDEREDGADIQNYLRSLTKQGTVPNIFVGGQHVGGNDDTQEAFRSGKLTELVVQAKA